jgi:tetratricopeptide (TPR) repeat protein
VFVIGLLILGGIESALTFSEAGDRISTRLHERIILARLARLPGDAVLLGELGDLYQASGRYSEAAEAYTASLRLNPENPTILNNLAWLLSTCPDPDIKNAPRALEIALKAVELELSAHILDTLAECYFANGLYEQAVEAGKKALGLASPPNDYYRDQLQKFESERRNKDF